MAIKEFKGPYRFLSNFYPAAVVLDNEIYPSVEHAYQAAKFSKKMREKFRNPNLKAGSAKRMGRGQGGPNWKKRSLAIMLDLVRQKFAEPDLREHLLRTGQEELIEGNWWGDTFYGVCRGVGENHLGKILMAIRKEILPGQ